MKPWHDGLPETTAYMLFPPAGQVEVYTADRQATQARLKTLMPDLTFEIADLSLSHQVEVIPICGEAGEGSRGMHAAPPSARRRREIEQMLSSFSLACGATN